MQNAPVCIHGRTQTLPSECISNHHSMQFRLMYILGQPQVLNQLLWELTLFVCTPLDCRRCAWSCKPSAGISHQWSVMLILNTSCSARLPVVIGTDTSRKNEGELTKWGKLLVLSANEISPANVKLKCPDTATHFLFKSSAFEDKKLN